MFGRKRKLQLQVEVMRDALLYYANRDTYRRRGVHPKGSPVRYEPAEIVNDHGSRARLALRTVDELAIRRLLRGRAIPVNPSAAPE